MPEKAIREGEVRVKRKDGHTFVPEAAGGSPLDVEGIDLDLTKGEIIEFIHEARKHS